MSNTDALQLMLRMKLTDAQLMYLVEVKPGKAGETEIHLNNTALEVRLGHADQQDYLHNVVERVWTRFLSMREGMTQRSRKAAKEVPTSDKEAREARKLHRAILKAHQQRKDAQRAANGN